MCKLNLTKLPEILCAVRMARCSISLLPVTILCVSFPVSLVNKQFHRRVATTNAKGAMIVHSWMLATSARLSSRPAQTLPEVLSSHSLVESDRYLEIILLVPPAGVNST